jgi:hypothetical protein
MFKFGIDWSEQHHNLCIRNSKGAIVSQVEFKHTLEGFQRFDDERRKLGVPPSECLVAIETAYNLLVDFLLDRGYLVYLIPPQATKGYRNRPASSIAHTSACDSVRRPSTSRQWKHTPSGQSNSTRSHVHSSSSPSRRSTAYTSPTFASSISACFILCPLSCSPYTCCAQSRDPSLLLLSRSAGTHPCTST